MHIAKTFKQGGIALAIGLMGISAAPVAQAADYDSNLIVQLTLGSVSAGTLGTDVIATFSSGVFGTPLANATGAATASYDPYFFTTSGYLEHDQNVTGSAYAPGGNAYSELLTNGYIHLDNTSGSDVTFTFGYAITGGANVFGSSGFASAFGSAEIYDSSYATSIYKDMSVSLAGTTSASISEIGTFSITLASGATNDISVLVNNNGTAVMAVPEPETYALMLAGLGLIGFFTRRKQQQAA